MLGLSGCTCFLGDSGPPSDITSWFKTDGWGRTGDKVIAHDIYAIGTQV